MTFFTYASINSPGHADLAILLEHLTALGLGVTVLPQTVLTNVPTTKQSATIAFNSDEWGLSGNLVTMLTT